MTVKNKSKAKRKRSCARGVCRPQRTQGLLTDVSKGEYELVNMAGPGLFIAAHVSKQGGTNDLTFVNLEIDGRNVTSLSFAAARNLGLTQQNPYGIVLLESDALANFTIGFPTPLKFSRSLKLSVTVNEEGIVQIIGNIIHGSSD